MQETLVSTGYTPRPHQATLHSNMRRFNVIVCHRRFGKTVFSLNDLLDRAFSNTRTYPQYAYIAPTYGQAEKIAWQMLKTYLKNVPGVEYNEAKLRCVIPRGADHITIYLLGAENPDGIRGMYFDGVILDEVGEMNPDIWGKVIRPALADRMGWAIFIGTPKGRNHFHTLYETALKAMKEGKSWFTAIYRASTSGVLPKEELDALRDEMTEDEWNQEMECDFAASITGAYWGKAISAIENKGRFGKVPHDPSLQVDTFWDLGVNDSATCWFVQQTRLEIRIIDYWEASGAGIPEFAKMLKEGHRADYNYRMHHWPHDGGSRDLSSGKERSTTARELGIRPLTVHPRYDVADSIDAARRLIPRMWFDKGRCTFYMTGDKGSRGIESLKNYTKKWDPKNKVFLDTPLHNWASHGADGFRLMGMALKPGEDRQNRDLPETSDYDYDIFDH